MSETTIRTPTLEDFIFVNSKRTNKLSLLERKQRSLRLIGKREDYIFLPERTHGKYHYPGLNVSMYKLGLNPEVNKVLKELNIPLSLSLQPQSKDYIDNITQDEAYHIAERLGGFLLNPLQYFNFHKQLRSLDATDANGNKISYSKRIKILNETRRVTWPSRGEWINARFIKGSENPNQEQFTLYELADYCEGDKQGFARINETELNNQGLPIKEGSDISYWKPKHGCGAIFQSCRTNDCLRYDCSPYSREANIGLRLAFIA